MAYDLNSATVAVVTGLVAVVSELTYPIPFASPVFVKVPFLLCCSSFQIMGYSFNALHIFNLYSNLTSSNKCPQLFLIIPLT